MKYLMIILLITTKNLIYIFDIYHTLCKCEFTVEFVNYTAFIKIEYFFNTSIVNMKNFLIYYIYLVTSRGRKIYHTSEMKIKTISNFSYLNYKNYPKTTNAND